MTAVSVKADEPTSGSVGEIPPDPTVGRWVSLRAGVSRYRGSWSVPAVAVTLLGAILLGFVADLTVIGAQRHHRSQRVKFDQLRADLANAVAPVAGANSDGKLYRLGTPIGALRIPRIGLNEVFSEGTTGSVLVAGPGHRRDTVLPGQQGTSVIMGRRAAFGGPFGSIDKLRVGDVVTVVTGQGTQAYSVLSVRRQSSSVALSVDEAKNELMLVTAGGADLVPSGLIVVESTLTSQVRPTAARVIGPASIGGSEQVLAGESGAWVRLVFWLQGLFLATIGVTFARARWGRMQAWIVGAPLLLLLAVQTANQVALLMPNLT